ncbi:hypothetical protein RB195_009292 [Necator americanus]|uniref:PPM-type phosphatase domain-containing protein n=1 Tax=Necator americanus TaxID=51031 RepID=A0ABR1CSP5_NECAM
MLDLSNNALRDKTTRIVTGPALKQLDLTCNSALNLTSGTLSRNYKKPVALYDIGAQSKDRIQIGFSETSGSRNKLCIRRVHCGDIFGMVDGSSNYELPKTIQSVLKKIISSTDHKNNLSTILLEAHEVLEEPGERLGASCLLLHIDSKLSLSYVGNIGAAVVANGNLEKLTETNEMDEEQYDRIRSAGGTVDENNLINGVTPNQRQLGFYSLHPVVIPKPINKSMGITREIDYVFVASSAVWEFLTDAQIASILTTAVNPQVAAKTIQDALQACDYNGNSCVVVIRLLKPELSFRSSALPQPELSVPVAHTPMKVEESSVQEETTLQKIEQRSRWFTSPASRLEKISEVIAKMEDDTTHEDTHALSGRQLYDRIAAQEKVSSWVSSPSSSMALPPPDPSNGKYSQLMDELRSKAILVDEFSASATTSSTPTVTESPANVAITRSDFSVLDVDTEDHLDCWKSAARKGLQRCYEKSLPEKITTPGMNSSEVNVIYSVECDRSLQTIQDIELFATLSLSDKKSGNNLAALDQNNHSEEKSLDFGVNSPFGSLKSHDSGTYSIQKAARERHIAGQYETVHRSFDYYSHTKVRPYDVADNLPSPPTLIPFMDSSNNSNIPYFEHASPRRRKMSVIEESPEMQTSSSEERVPSTTPPPLPKSGIPNEHSKCSFIRNGLRYARVVYSDADI